MKRRFRGDPFFFLKLSRGFPGETLCYSLCKRISSPFLLNKQKKKKIDDTHKQANTVPRCNSLLTNGYSGNSAPARAKDDSRNAKQAEIWRYLTTYRGSQDTQREKKKSTQILRYIEERRIGDSDVHLLNNGKQ
jgi:hypothetical protein